MSISENIKSIRKAKKMTQQEVSDILKINRLAFTRLETMGNDLTFTQIVNIASALEVSVNKLLDGIEISLENKEIETLRNENKELNAKIEELNDLKDYNKRLKESVENYKEVISFVKIESNIFAISTILFFIDDLLKAYNEQIREYNLEYEEYLKAISIDTNISVQDAESYFKEKNDNIFKEISSKFHESFTSNNLLSKIDATIFQRFIYFDEFLKPEYTNEQIDFLRNQFIRYVSSKIENHS